MSSRNKLVGRIVLVAGGGGEIGGAIARHCALEGAAVAVCDVAYDNAAAVCTSINALGGIPAPFQLDAQHRCTRIEAILDQLSRRLEQSEITTESCLTQVCCNEATPTM